MINVTVKTLDSQNHKFSVDDNFTVEQFKNHIADTVNVPAARQRIIYCGRVLQDNSKLSEYDVDGKVVHLVQRAPPNSTNRNVRSLTPPPDLNSARGGFRGFDRNTVGNAVYMGMGSMTFPQGLMDPQQMIPPRATHTLSASRLNVARRMLRNAENVIRLLENRAATNETPAQEETVEEEMTPVIEARLIVPPSGDHPIDANAIFNTIQNTIFPPIGVDTPLVASTSSANDEASTIGSSTSTPGTSTPRTSSTENLNAESNAETPREEQRQSRACRGTEMATLLQTLNELQVRFAPFLTRYQEFMQYDPVLPQENVQEARDMLNRVSQVLHFFGHAYHSLSDIIINVSQPPPRLLLCRPILIQPPTVLQAGIPIQVEAQINLSADRPGGSTTSNATSTTSTGTTTNTTNLNNPPNPLPNPPAGTQPQQAHPAGPSITLQPGLVGLPLMPAGSMRVITAPLDIRPLRPFAPGPRPASENTSNLGSSTAPDASAVPPTTEPQTAETGPRPQLTQSGPNIAGGVGGPPGQFGPNNANLEFFMEVTPDALRGGNFLQSIMQLVDSQLGTTFNQGQNQRGDGSGATGQPGNAQSQPSQARSTQTNPTTATHTRSTPRPHVHMRQQAVQGGFDPFLHCFSHHIAHVRPQRAGSGPQAPQQGPSVARETASTTSSIPPAAPRPQGTVNADGNVASHIEALVRELRVISNTTSAHNMMADAFLHSMRQHTSPQSTAPPRGAPDGHNPINPNTSQSDTIFGFLNNFLGQALPDLMGGRVSAFDLFSNPSNPYVPGTNLIMDFIMILLRNIGIDELLLITTRNLAPFERQANVIQQFFLTEVCQNDTSDAGITRATERLLNAVRPITNEFELMPTRNNIDIVRTIDGFCRNQFPNIIRLGITNEPRVDGTAGTNVSVLMSSIWSVIKELLALTLHCSSGGISGVESVFSRLMVSGLLGNEEFQHVGLPTLVSLVLRELVLLIDVDVSRIQQYIVHNAPEQSTTLAPVDPIQQTQSSSIERQNSVEPMEVDSATSPSRAETLVDSAPIRVDEPEPLPNVIWGSEPWHTQTPEEWVPIITNDVQRQRKQNIQPPFSDAYLSGMPSKRRKLISKSKPQGSLPQAISENIRQAVTSTGLASTAPLEVVAQAASESPDIQTAYRNLLQSRVQTNLRNNEDFDREKYPHTARYFNESSE